METVDGGGLQPRRVRYFRKTARDAPAPNAQLTTYTVAYIAHTPLEPRAAVAEWEGDKVTIWTGSQRPFGVRSELAGNFKLPEEGVRIIMPDTGSGYGGKHTGEAALEAARLAKAAGKPVKRNVDARGGDDVGLLPPRRRDRSGRTGQSRTASSRNGNSTITTPDPPAMERRTPSPNGRSSTIQPTRRCGRAPTAGWRPPPITSCANPIWMNWRTGRAWTRWNSV